MAFNRLGEFTYRRLQMIVTTVLCSGAALTAETAGGDTGATARALSFASFALLNAASGVFDPLHDIRAQAERRSDSHSSNAPRGTVSTELYNHSFTLG